MTTRPFPVPEAPKNPFLRGLLTIGIVGLLVGAIFATTGATIDYNSGGGEDTSVQFTSAALVAGTGIIAMLLWVHGRAMLWKPGRAR